MNEGWIIILVVLAIALISFMKVYHSLLELGDRVSAFEKMSETMVQHFLQKYSEKQRGEAVQKIETMDNITHKVATAQAIFQKMNESDQTDPDLKEAYHKMLKYYSFYHDAVLQYNQYYQQFGHHLIAHLLGFDKVEIIEI